jgi:LIVCS family branched-chain amino acid:cation transporter
MNSGIGKKIPFSYGWMMLITILITVIFSNLGFATIMNFLAPILALCYPAIIVLTLCNILYKLYGFPYVKTPFYLTLLGMIIWEYTTVGGIF